MSDGQPSIEDVMGWATSLSNWGRWGSDDDRGTLNLITDEVRRAAAAEVRVGRTVACSWEIVANARLGGAANRFMVATGEGLPGPDPTRHVHAATDIFQMQIHGGQFTHLDALSHWFLDGKLYNDRPGRVVTSDRGAVELGIETVHDGIVTRGVLLDVAAARGVAALEPGEAVGPDDLEAAEARQGVRVRSGDAVLLHTGHSATRRADPAVASASSWAGWGAACLPWFHEREVAVIAAEASNEVMPNPYAALGKHPVHSIGIVAMGLWLIDNCDLEGLAAACAEVGQWSFLFCVAPLLVRGATGSPVTPVAVL